MCEYCENTFKRSTPFPLRPGFQFTPDPDSDQGETPEAEASEKPMSEAGRDVLGLVRVSAKLSALGSPADLNPAQVNFVCMVLGVPASEQAIIMKEVKPAKKKSPGDAFVEALEALARW